MLRIFALAMIAFLMIPFSAAQTTPTAQTPPTTGPTSSPTLDSIQSYQEILDRLNAEYGTDVRLADVQESAELDAALGISGQRPFTPLDEFERRIRKAIEEMLEAKKTGYYCD